MRGQNRYAVEDHLKLSGAEFDAWVVGRGSGEVIAAGFQALAPQAQAVSAPVENLEAVGRAVTENKEMAGERVGLESGADEVEQPVEAETHIDGLRTKPELDGWRQAQHEEPPRAETRERTQARSVPGGKRKTAPVGRRSSTAGAGCCSRTGSKRGSCSWGW